MFFVFRLVFSLFWIPRFDGCFTVFSETLHWVSEHVYLYSVMYLYSVDDAYNSVYNILYVCSSVLTPSAGTLAFRPSLLA